jgi:hypothetical protein
MILMRALLATALVTLACASEASAAPNARGNFGDCGTIDLEFTEGEVKAFGMSCRAAREVFRAWEAKVNCPDKPCERTRVGSFNCRFGGSDVKLKLRCTDKGRERAMKAHWGG